MLSSQKPRRVLNVFILAMLNISIMLSLRTLPVVAQLGLSSIFFFFIVGIFFLLPCALVSAELATGWPKSGGIYIWVREALGDRLGFFSIWMQWIHNVAWYPVILSFIAATLAYLTYPELAENKFYILTVILSCFWGMTIFNYFGLKVSSKLSSIGVIAGSILPGLFIIGLGIFWIATSNTTSLPFKNESFLPDLKSINNLVFLAGLFLAFSGLEVSASLAGEVKQPQKTYPRAISLAAFTTFFILVLGALTISCVIPPEQISLVAGLMEALEKFLPTFGLLSLKPILGGLLILGALAEVNSWLISPVKGLHATSLHGNLPPFFQNLNKHGTPTHLLFFQGLIVSITSLVFLFMPNTSSAFWILTVLSAQSYLIMYIMMFISAIRLRYSKPNVPRVYKIPFPHKGIWLVSSMGIAASVFTITVGFIPPAHLEVGSPIFYKAFLGVGLVIMCVIPLIIYQFKKPSWYLSITRAHQEKEHNS
jgi:glutamate:GABA antiporter